MLRRRNWLGAIALTAILSGTSALALAQNAGPEEAKQTVALSQVVFEKLQQAQELIESKQYADGHQLLRKLREKKNLSAYEAAQIWNLDAYAFYLQERYQQAIGAYENVLAAGDIPAALVQSSLKTLGQLYFTIEDYPQALKTVKRLVQIIDKPSADVYMLLGQAYFQLSDYAKAVNPISTAITQYETQGKVPRENWLLLLRVCYYELKDFNNMLHVLNRLIALYPKQRYLMTLAGVYSELGDTRKQLALTEALYESGKLDRAHDVVNLANLYLLHGVPYKAAQVLQTGINDTTLDADLRNLSLLAQAWNQAREHNKATGPLARAAELSDDGELFVRLAQSYTNLERWQEAAQALQRGIKKGGLKRADIAHVMLGMALFNQQRYSAARSAFLAAARDERSKKNAHQWIAYLESEEQRDTALNERSREPRAQAN